MEKPKNQSARNGSRIAVLLAVISAFAIGGIILTALSSAATDSVGIEPEDAGSSDSVVVSNGGFASGGKFIKFNFDDDPVDPPDPIDPVEPGQIADLPDACSTTDIIEPAVNTDVTDIVQNMQPGQTLLLQDGNYRLRTSGSGDTIFTNSGTKAQPICIVAANQPDRQDTPNGMAGTVSLTGGGSIFFNDTKWWRFQGIDFKNRSIRLTGSSPNTDFHFDFVNTYFTNTNRGTATNPNALAGDSIIAKDVNHIAIRDSYFSYIRSLKVGIDRVAFMLQNESRYIEYTNNVCENVSADCIQAQGNQPKSGGQIQDVLIQGNVMRINRPHPSGDTFCNTGENGIDVKIGKDWTLRDNTFSGFQEINGCDNRGLESTSGAGEAIVLHKNGGLNFLFEGNTFSNNSDHIKIIGKSCTAGGSQCAGSQGSENITIRNNTFNNGSLTNGAARNPAITINPSQAANARALGDSQFKIPRNVTIESNSFSNQSTNVSLTNFTDFKFGQNSSESSTVNGITSFFDPAPNAGGAKPEGTIYRDNNFNGQGNKINITGGVECTGNDCS